MSGIAAVLHLDGSPVPQAEIERVGNVLRPYGPDRQRVLIRGSAAFAFCLHQLTPEDALERQPLVLANRFVLLFDGRIDNREELGATIGINASELRTLPDSIIALRLFDRWGEGGFERILGDWAIIVMDLVERRLICVRDHMGLRALHYYHSAQRFAVATVPEALFALSWVPRVVNVDKVGDAMVNRGLNGKTTYYQQIYRVMPGFALAVSNKGLHKNQFWNPENIPNVKFKHDDDYVTAFQDILEFAVKNRLRARRTPASLITGGLDLSSISVVAADILASAGKKLHTFTAVPEPGYFRDDLRKSYVDETPYVRQIADYNTNIIPYFIAPSKGPIIEKIASQVRLGGSPDGDMLNGIWMMDIMAEARSLGHDVMLCGDIGNHTMSYDGWSLIPELLRAGRWLRLLTELRSSSRDWRQVIRQNMIAPFIPAPVFRAYKRWRRRGETALV